ncbi:MAG TPA: hypothetical protein VK891_05610 [Euzebyales bacterium]|nr:hypothetical protein [Euzebyales bacterium]
MTADRLDDCRDQLEGVDEQPLEVRADTLELVHRALVAELDDLLDTDRRHVPRG